MFFHFLNVDLRVKSQTQFMRLGMDLLLGNGLGMFLANFELSKLNFDHAIRPATQGNGQHPLRNISVRIPNYPAAVKLTVSTRLMICSSAVRSQDLRFALVCHAV